MPVSDHIYVAVGAVINLIAGIMTLLRYNQRNEGLIWFLVTSYQRTNIKHMDLGLGIVTVTTGLIMLAEILVCLFL